MEAEVTTSEKNPKESQDDTATEKEQPTDQVTESLLAIKTKEIDKFLTEASKIHTNNMNEAWGTMFRESQSYEKSAIDKVNKLIQSLAAQEKALTTRKDAMMGKFETVSTKIQSPTSNKTV
uniref:Uncharacterized protein n=1 Tax=Ciona savignyi TaxID=51511 RepID=H2Y531_CIOSA